MDAAGLKVRVAERVDARADALDRLALEIHARPELAYEERFAADALASYLSREGADVRRSAGGLETAFVAEAGSGRPVVAILGEYDALPGVGHACGHNLMGTAAAGAFLALRDVAGDVKGRVRVVGCPAEERGNGKVALIKAGVFADVDAALMYHPGDRDELDPLMLAMVTLDVELRGKAAHAAAEPHEGVNALDGLILGWNALSALRLVVRSDSRVHGIITDGGKAANIIPDRAAARLMVRSPDNAYLGELRQRVLACFEGAALATGCELRYEWSDVCEVVRTNRPLAEAFSANAGSLGRSLQPRRPADTHGSTDMGNVSTVVPGIHPFLAITPGPVPGHSIEFAAAAATPRALETMRVAAKALAMTAIDVLCDPSLARRAREAHAGR
ncbi:MAG: M20 family metallopeptidase [Chloroflexi bacterium]|nr:MAG: M20 family metallopeptidase [Chloroflexota bacterium]TMG34330.1 MAG: M20 family metallopeptidase [Chloroflexota bacterium]